MKIVIESPCKLSKGDLCVWNRKSEIDMDWANTCTNLIY